MSDQNEPRHPIAVVARRSGLSQQILRAWERRYNLVTPQRTPTGRRLYTDRDLEMLGLLKSLIDSGYRVGSLKERTLSELRDMATTELDASVSAPQAGPDGDTKALLDEALDATAALDPERLEAVLQRASVALSRPALRSLFLQPLLTAIGMRWQSGELRIAHEHMASSLIHTFLASLNNRRRSPIGAPRLVAATLPGQQHELGLLLATSHVLDLGWDVIYLGADLPIEEIARRLTHIRKTAAGLGVRHPDPLLTLITLTGAAIPYLRICEEGLVNLKDGKTRPLLIKSQPGQAGIEY